MSTAPLSPSTKELKEIYELVGHMWGPEFTSADQFKLWSTSAYAVKFDFHSGGPGYVGDLFMVYGDALTEHPPIMLIRDDSNKLLQVHNEE